jgi:hypothetical protein
VPTRLSAGLAHKTARVQTRGDDEEIGRRSAGAPNGRLVNPDLAFRMRPRQLGAAA